MNAGYWVALLLATAIACGYHGREWGLQDGRAEVKAQQDRQTVADLTGLVASHQALIKEANSASRSLRAATTKRAEQDARATQEFKDALAQTEGSRIGCVFPDDVMRRLGAARDRAAAAAAGGTRAALPEAGGAADAR